MLQITIPKNELWDGFRQQFITMDTTVLHLEHSLVSISKWESKWHKAFLGKQEKTNEEIMDYIRCMTIDENVNEYVYLGLTNKNIEDINRYIEEPMTAVYFPNSDTSQMGDTVTSELIYYWMLTFNIPFECQEWHLNRLLALIKVCAIKNQPPNKRSSKQIMEDNARLNQQRRARLNSKG